MLTEVIHYRHAGLEFKGYLAKPSQQTKKLPAIIVAHAWFGQDEFARKKAEALAALGYVAFAADLYGNGVTARNSEEALKLMLPLFLDRKLLRERMNAALEALKKQSCVDQEAIGAIGFCFGGLSVIEFMRSGAHVKGIVSFHGLLGNTLGKYQATPLPNSEKIHGSLLILHGYKDPLVPHSDVLSIQSELTKANVNWQMNIYGQASHAFTNPEANDESGGMLFNQQVADRAWQAMAYFFNETFIHHF